MTEIAPVTIQSDQSWRPLFLRLLRNAGTIRAAAEMVGVTTHKVRAAMRLDPSFAELVNDCLTDAAELLEKSAFERAIAGDNLMTIFLLKGYLPDKYRENNGRAQDKQQTNVHIKTYVGWDPDTWDAHQGKTAPQTIDVKAEQIEQRANPDLSVQTPALADSTVTR